MTWLSLLKVLLQLANNIAQLIREKQLLDAGEARATAKSLTEIAKRLEIGDAIRAEVMAMTDDELIKEAIET